MRTLDRFGRLPAGSVQPGPDVHRLARMLSYSPYIGLVLVGNHLGGDCLPSRGGSDEEGFGAGQVALSPQQDIHHLPPSSTARYKYAHRPPTRTYVSSHHQRCPGADRMLRWAARLRSGPNLCAQLRMVLADTSICRSASRSLTSAADSL